MKKRARTERRERERAARSIVRDRERLFLLSPGGSAARPIEVSSASVIDVKWRALPCPQCEGTLTLVDEHAADAANRSTNVRCAECGAKRTLFFRIVARDN